MLKVSFETNLNQGLKVHMKRKHTEITKEKYQTNCEICNEELKTCREMKKHMQQHSYKKSNIKVFRL